MLSSCSSAGLTRATNSGLARQVACLTAGPHPPRSNCRGEVRKGRDPGVHAGGVGVPGWPPSE
jgi:hypothetical protein